MATHGNKNFNRLAKILEKKGYRPSRSGRPIALSKSAYKKIGTNAHEFNKWQRNEKQPDIRQAYKLARVLNIHVTDLYNEKKQAA